jgi:hypothetical protein
MWSQLTGTTTDVCSGTAAKYFDFDAAQGQSGSSFWTPNDYTARFVLSNGGAAKGNGAVAITPTYYSWISDFTEKYIM